MSEHERDNSFDLDRYVVDEIRGKTPRAIVYLWTLIPIGMLGGLLTFGLIGWIYHSVHQASLEAEQIDQEIMASVAGISSISEDVESEFRSVFDLDSQAVAAEPDSFSLLESEILTLQHSIERVNDDGRVVIVPVSVEALQSHWDTCFAWRTEQLGIREAKHEAMRNLDRAITHFRAKLDSMHGIHRIHSIQAARKLSNGEAEDLDRVIRTFLDESRSGTVLGMCNAQISDLELVCLQLIHSENVDLLSSYLENEIRPRLDRLRLLVQAFQDRELIDLFHQTEHCILGPVTHPDFTPDECADATHTGLYVPTRAFAIRQHEADGLQAESFKLFGQLDKAVVEQIEVAKDLRTRLAEIVSGSLKTGALTVLAFGLVAGALYTVLAVKGTISIQSFVKDLRRSHKALEAANKETLNANIEIRRSAAERERLQHQLLEAQKLESIGQLAAGIAHEINTPAQYVGDNTRFLQNEFVGIIRVLDCYSEQIDRERGDIDWKTRFEEISATLEEVDYDFLREEIPLAISQSIEGIERITKIVRAMKEFSHPGSVHKEPADLNGAIRSTSIVCTNRWKTAADLEFDLDESLGLVPCYLAEVNQVILNLIVNAADAIETFHGAEGRKGMIKITTTGFEDRVRILVEDNGGGMPDSVRQRIFDPFFTTKEVGKGTGQGLAISRDVIVNKHGGSLSCQTQEGVGTTFIIEIPLSNRQEESAALQGTAA